jgi:hypothetical protein
MKVYRVRNWNELQNIKSRRPKWIMLYRRLLDDLEWHNLPPDSAKILINLWLISSENFGNLPDVSQLSFRLRISEQQVKDQLERLSQWIVNEEVDISTIEKNAVDKPFTTRRPLVNNMSVEREKENEKETEKKERKQAVDDKSYPQGNVRERTRLPLDWKLSTEDEEFCRTSRPELSLEKTFDKFCDYWHTQQGVKALQLNWTRQWRRWVRAEITDGKNTKSNSTIQVNPDIAKTKARAAKDDALPRHGPSLETLQAIARIKGQRLQ